MGAGASSTPSPSVSRQESNDVTKPKLTQLRTSQSTKLVLALTRPEMRRRPSVFDELEKSAYDSHNNDGLQGGNQTRMEPETRVIVVRAIEAFLTINGTDLRDSVINTVVDTMSAIALKQGQAAITQGEIGTSVYIVASGNLLVTMNGERIRKLGPGALFGELALLFDARRSATVTCIDNCKLWSLSRTSFKIIQRNATNLAIQQRTRRFQVVPELAGIPSTDLAKLMATLTPMSYKSGETLYAAGKCSTKIMLIEEGMVNIVVPPALQHLPQEEIERLIGIIRPSSYVPNVKNRREYSDGQDLISAFMITEGCVIGMGILLGKIGSARGWIWVDAKVDGKPYVGAMPPITAVAVGTVKTAFFTVYRFERTFGSAEDFYETFFDQAMAREKEIWPPGADSPEPVNPILPVVPGILYDLDYFDEITPFHSINMGHFASAVRRESSKNRGRRGSRDRENKDVSDSDVDSNGLCGSPSGRNNDKNNGDNDGVTDNDDSKENEKNEENVQIKKYVLKRLSKSSIMEQKNIESILDETKILESLNNIFILKLYGKFHTKNELIFVFEQIFSADLWNIIHESDFLRDQDGILKLSIVKFYTANIILALEYIHHKKIVYRNLKPENILVDSNGYIKVTGMSFAKVVPFMTPQGSLRVTTFTFCGTLEYMSPEMILNRGHDQGVDKWALGVLLYEMLTGVTPFDPSLRATPSESRAGNGFESNESKISKIKFKRISSETRMLSEYELTREDKGDCKSVGSVGSVGGSVGGSLVGSPSGGGGLGGYISGMNTSVNGSNAGSVAGSISGESRESRQESRHEYREHSKEFRHRSDDGNLSPSLSTSSRLNAIAISALSDSCESKDKNDHSPSDRDRDFKDFRGDYRSDNGNSGNNRKNDWIPSRQDSGQTDETYPTLDADDEEGSKDGSKEGSKFGEGIHSSDHDTKLLATIAGLMAYGVDLPHDLSGLSSGHDIISLIHQLLHPDPVERLDFRRDMKNNVFHHDFFSDLDWTALSNRTFTAPYIPDNHNKEYPGSKYHKNIISDYTGDDSVYAGF